MKNVVMTLLAASVALASPAFARHRDTPEVELQKLLAGRVAGKPTYCINLRNATQTHIIDGTALVYQVGSTLYVNTPQSGADAIDDDDILLTRTTGSELCNIDVVHMIDRTSGVMRGFVVLDKFVPYTKPPRAG